MLLRLLGLIIIVALLWAIKRYIFEPKNQSQHSATRPRQSSEYHEALQILNIQEPLTEPKVMEAYKRLMNKVHPDKGGSAHFATQLNKAKQTLLQHIKENRH